MLLPRLSPTSLSSDTSHFKKLVKTEPCLSQGLCYSAWEEELGDDIDKEFILNGIRNGFDIIDKNASPKPVCLENHASAKPGSPLYDQATEQVLKEIRMGNYEVVSYPPDIISPMGGNS